MEDVKFAEDDYGVSYDALIETMGFHEVLVEESDNDYQGSTYMLVRKYDEYGQFTYGWGSCSGCDAAQAVSTQQEANQLRDDLYFGIRWFDSPAAALEWLETDDHDLQWYGHDTTFNKFRDEAKEALRALLVTPEDVEQAKASIKKVVTE